MEITLVPALPKHLETLNNLMQLYLYDFSVYFCNDPLEQIGENGLYDPGFAVSRYLGSEGYQAYLGRVDGKLAGFALISDRLRYQAVEGRHIDEFFVLRCYRRQGVGRALAYQVFDTYRGYWEITQIGENLPAQNFWRRVIGDYTQGQYSEVADEEWDEIWQWFDSTGW